MEKLEILRMLRELLRDATYSHTDPDDLSGLSTVYYVDQERLMRNIEADIEEIENRGPKAEEYE